MPGIVLGGARAERFGYAFDACDPPPCALGDDLCREAAHAAVIECVHTGALGPPPDALATLVRASGGGVTLTLYAPRTGGRLEPATWCSALPSARSRRNRRAVRWGRGRHSRRG